MTGNIGQESQQVGSGAVALARDDIPQAPLDQQIWTSHLNTLHRLALHLKMDYRRGGQGHRIQMLHIKINTRQSLSNIMGKFLRSSH